MKTKPEGTGATPAHVWELRAASIELWSWVEREDVPADLAAQMRARARSIDALVGQLK